MKADPFSKFKKSQKTSWGAFSPLEIVTTIPAATLVKFSGVAAHQTVLDVGCGTGVVAITAARAGANVFGLDLSPVLIEHAQENTKLAKSTYHRANSWTYCQTDPGIPRRFNETQQF
jgi:ribosomal protein L11 methylase PrmA